MDEQATAVGRMIETTGGPVAAPDLGRTLVHEHVLMRPPGSQWDPRATFDRNDVIERAVDAIAALADHGVRTLVDPCPMELGRDPEVLAEVASRTGVKIVCATGFYIEQDAWGIPFYWRQRHPEEIAELFIAELENGIKGSGIRPGIIKAATGTSVGFHERKVLRAAGMAAAHTGAAVLTHTEKSAHGDEQQDLLAGGGADLARCLIGHLDMLRLDELAGIAERGSMVGIDRVGWDILGSDNHRADLVAGMIEQGLGSHVCISQDRSCTLWTPRPTIFGDGMAKGLTFLFTEFLPMLRERGVTDDQIDELLVTNPRRLLAGVSSVAGSA